VKTALYSVALLSSAFLLFCIEPLVAKMLLPIAGGVPAVWSTCLVFFQVTLLAGYAFTQATLERMRPRAQALVYLVLCPAALVALPIAIPHRELGASPALSVLAILAAAVAVPFFVLSTLAPALQRWFSATGSAHAADPYFLYAASNTGSLLALAAYPLVIEPSIDLDVQSRALRVAFVVLAGLVAACAFAMRDASALAGPRDDEPRIGWARRARWVVLAAVPSAQLVAVTSHVTTTVAPAPLLWAVPLAAYLASFVIVFARRRVPHAIVARRLPFAVVVGMLLLATGANHPEWLVIALHVIVLLAVAVFCHGALAEDRPAASRLPEFYTWMSVGGAIGGAAAALAAPVLLKQPIEYPVCLLLALACLPAGAAPRWAKIVAVSAVASAVLFVFSASRVTGLLGSALACAPLLVAFALDRHPRAMTWALAGIVLVQTSSEDARGHVLVRERSFFGAFSVVRVAGSAAGGTARSAMGDTLLQHGNTMHGLQLARDPHEPTLYYSHEGPIGDVIGLLSPRLRRVAVIGLGTGTLATYAQPGQHWRFFELDPAVVRIARDPRYFTFLSDAFGNRSDVVVGDARIEIAKDEGGYDLLVVDAFSSDAIPTHLLTREALATYRSKLAKGAVIAWHVTNRYLDLKPVLASLADDARLALLARDDGDLGKERVSRGHSPSLWIVMAELGSPELADLRARGWTDVARRPGFRCWTDERASIVTVWR
jgi:hypothetical protein